MIEPDSLRMAFRGLSDEDSSGDEDGGSFSLPSDNDEEDEGIDQPWQGEEEEPPESGAEPDDTEPDDLGGDQE